jgi:hypothetical protein
MQHGARLFLLVLVLSFLLMGNMAPPYAPCVGKAEGDSCTPGYSCSASGVCQLLANCTDNPGSSANECLLCEN